MSDREVVRLPNIPAEYHYVQRLSCQECGEAVRGKRRNSRPSNDGRMEDLWDITCLKCGAKRELILSVPMIDILGMLGMKDKKQGDP